MIIFAGVTALALSFVVSVRLFNADERIRGPYYVFADGSFRLAAGAESEIPRWQTWADPAWVWPQIFPFRNGAMAVEKAQTTLNTLHSLITGRGFNLSGTALDPAGERLAIINGRFLRAGDRINGARVIQVENGRVRLAILGRSVYVSM